MKDYIALKVPYFSKITRKYRFEGVIKDRAWAILSDYVRMRDFILYGTCVATGSKIGHWRDGDAGHFYSMGGHGALSGFDPFNVHLQSKHSNHMSSFADGAPFERELVRRYGEWIIKHLRDQANATVKADDFFFIQKIRGVYDDFLLLKEQHPNYDYPEYLN
jgi:hypothetical protein